jgi:hypothetical protein
LFNCSSGWEKEWYVKMKTMFNRLVVHEALKNCYIQENNPKNKINKPAASQDRFISLLLHDIFGGEILKTHLKRGWHFYNRIDGERIDFTRSNRADYASDESFEDIPSTPGETCNNVEQVDYSVFFMRFIRAFEEAIGLDKNIPGMAT